MTHRTVLFALVATLAGATRGEPQDTDAVAAQRSTGLVEEVARELVQLDVRVEGPAAVLASLGPADFRVVIGGRPIEQLVVDRACAGEAATLRAAVEGALSSTAARAYRTSYLLYFDQPHLTIDGRSRAIELARRLVPEVLRDGGRARIVSAGPRLESTAWTDDPAELLDALERLERDPLQVDAYSAREEQRVAETLRALETRVDLAKGMTLANVARLRDLAAAGMGLDSATNNLVQRELAAIEGQMDAASEGAMGVARTYQRDERAHTRSALERFTLALGSLGTVAPPKAVLYFADTVRANAGDHYVTLFTTDEPPIVEGVLPALDEVIRAAATHGVRLYTVQAAGLTAESNPENLAGLALAFSGGVLATSKRFGDAKSALGRLAAETGGRAFLHGASAETIARRLHDDLGCMFLLGFDPADLPRDRALAVRVRSRAPGVRVSARPSLVVRGEATRRRERIAQAFVEPGTTGDAGGLRIAVIPTDIGEDHYSALVQIALPPVDHGAATWDVGMSLVTGSEVRDETAGRVSLDRPGVPLIYEAVLVFPPGPYELIAVAHDPLGDRVESVRVLGYWPDLGATAVGLGPLIAIQPAEAAFVRGDALRVRGSRGLDEQEGIDPTQYLALVGIACGAGAFAVERHLVGESTTGFPEIRPALGERCVLFRDLVPAGVLLAGDFRYEAVVRADGDGAVLGSAARHFVVLDAAVRASATPR